MAVEKSAGAVVYRKTEDGKVMYLLLQPAPGKPWGFPKGKIDAGETERQAAVREISEEAGLPPVTLDPTFRHVVHYTYRRGRQMVKKDVVYFLARTDTAEIRISWEHVAFRWAALADALTLVAYDNARDTLRAADAFLHGTGQAAEA
jgi:8-oxo-dGTP pyrophosphatase MutT (NUDIX family)